MNSTCYSILSINSNIRVEIIQPEKIYIELVELRKTQIDKCWNEHNQFGSLFNGRIFNFNKAENVNNNLVIFGYFIEYKNFFAQRHLPDMKLGITPLGVTGVTLIDDETDPLVIFGRRSVNVTQYPGKIEVIPSGAIDDKFITGNTIDFTKNLIAELEEETEIQIDDIQYIKPIGLIFDKVDEVYDVVCSIILKNHLSRLTRYQRSKEEYNSLSIIKVSELDVFINNNSTNIVPAALAAIKTYLSSNNSL